MHGPIKLASSARQKNWQVIMQESTGTFKWLPPSRVGMEREIICSKMEYLIKYGQMSSYMLSGCELDWKRRRWMDGLL